MTQYKYVWMQVQKGSDFQHSRSAPFYLLNIRFRLHPRVHSVEETLRLSIKSKDCVPNGEIPRYKSWQDNFLCPVFFSDFQQFYFFCKSFLGRLFGIFSHQGQIKTPTKHLWGSLILTRCIRDFYRCSYFDFFPTFSLDFHSFHCLQRPFWGRLLCIFPLQNRPKYPQNPCRGPRRPDQSIYFALIWKFGGGKG